MVRLVHARAIANLGELLTAYQARPMAAEVMRDMLRRLTMRGWLDSVRAPRPGRPKGVAWMVSEDGHGYMGHAGRLPYAPAPLGSNRWQASSNPQVDIPQGEPLAPPRPDPMHAPVWVCRPAPALRPGADDHKRFASRGLSC